jgi:phosphotransferase system enzyme I (PtsI)
MTNPAPLPKSKTFQGIPVSPGIQIGKIHKHDPVQAVLSRRLVSRNEIKSEKAALKAAIERAIGNLSELREKVRASLDEAHASIFDPQILILQDPVLIEKTLDRIDKNRENAAMAFMTVIQQFADQFKQLGDVYLASRNSDVLDVGNRVAALLASQTQAQAQAQKSESLQFKEDIILLAPDLSPSDTATMDHVHVKGFATELGGPTSHTAILARALEMPAIVGIGSFLAQTPEQAEVIIDGYEGTLTINPTPREIARARARHRRHLVHERDLAKLKNLPAETIDGYAVELAANVELPIEIPHVKAHGAESIGLFRTEFQYMERSDLPSEDDLFQVYKQVLVDMGSASVIFRTMDLGGDKFTSALGIDHESNPFLGLRAIRLCLAYPQVFRTQLRAILRASAFGNARIMYPLISNIHELRKANEILEQVRDELRLQKIAFDPEMQVGVMIEIPSAAICADQFAKEVDFFSIGTNDLIQYTLAVDRGNEQVASLYDPFHPAILRLIRTTIEAAQREGIWVGLCGEMSSNPLCALMLIGLGINELSMGSLAIPEIKRLIRQIRLADARKIVEDIYGLRSSTEIHDYVRQAYRLIQRKKKAPEEEVVAGAAER